MLLAALFADPSIRRSAIVAGQFLGMGVLTAASAIAARLAFSIHPGWVALLGLAPLVLGILKLRSLRAPPDEDDEAALTREHRFEQRMHSQVLAVTSITIANGGDNLAVYIPLFASTSLIVICTVVFALMTALLCALGYYAVHNPVFGSVVRRHGRVALPFVLIALGLYILSGSLALF